MRQDGFGIRLIVSEGALGRVERLALAPGLATTGSEQAIRARAAYLMRLAPGVVGRVLRVERKEASLWMLSEIVDGVSLADVLAALEFQMLQLSDEEVVALLDSVGQGAGRMHEALGGLAHGALCPMHVTLRQDASALFTGAVFADALQALKLDRERAWREFGVVLPASAGQPKFDRRADVAQLGALVLAIAHRRSLRRDEVPTELEKLVANVPLFPSSRMSSRLKIWLRDALQLHGRVVFESCEDASRKLCRVLASVTGDPAPAFALRTAILQLCDDT